MPIYVCEKQLQPVRRDGQQAEIITAVDTPIGGGVPTPTTIMHNNTSHCETYITGINSGMVTTALGFTPYSASNPSNYITSSALSGYAPIENASFTGDLYVCGNIRASGDVSAFSAENAPLNWWDSMPTASSTVKGGVKIGSGIGICNGVISVTGGTGGVSCYCDLCGIPTTFAPTVHNNTAHCETYITSAALSGYAPLANPRFTGTMGIGTTSPSSILDIHGGKFVIESNNGSFGQIQILNTENSEVSMVFASNVISGQGGALVSTDPKYIWAIGGGAYGVGQDKFVIASNVGYGGAIMTATHTGNVMIGTTTPAAKLTVVQGDSNGIIVTNNSAANASLVVRNSAGAASYGVYADSGNKHFFNGYFGIGETSPQSTLTVRKDVAGGRGGEISIINYAASTLGSSTALNFGLEASTYAGDDNNAQIKAIITNAGSSATDMVFSLWSGAGFNEYLRIKNDGKVGIGTSAPHANFITTVAGGSVWKGGIFAKGTTNAVAIGEQAGVAQIGGHNAAGTAWANIAINGSGGKVGIGTLDPDYLLTVGDDATAATALMNINGPENQQKGLVLTSAGTTKWYMYNPASSADLRFFNGTADRMTLTTAGNLSVVGEVTAYSSSDERLKENIQPFCALQIINKIQPVTFQWNERAKELNDKKDDRNNFGLIAQQVEEILPELVHEIYEDYKSVDYVQLIPILLQAVKELQLEINNLKKELCK